MAFLIYPRHGLQIHLSPLSDIIGAFLTAIHIRISPVTRNANAVPTAAPVSPSPSPGMCIVVPSIVMSLVGNMAMKLNITSSRHINTLIMLGIFMLPELFSIADAIMPTIYIGRAVL